MAVGLPQDVQVYARRNATLLDQEEEPDFFTVENFMRILEESEAVDV